MSPTEQLIGGRYQFIQALNTHRAGRTFLAADVHYPGHPKCVVRQLRLPTRNPMSRKFILSLLRKKVEVLEVIGQHEQVPSTFAAFDVEQNFYIVQEFIPGRSLKAELIVGQPWPSSKVMQFLGEVLPVLSFAQEHGIVHGNLKPSKMVRQQTTDQLVLLDFGAIKSISQSISSKENANIAEQLPIEDRLYIAPEQYQKQSLFCSDHYALGVLAIQALTGLSARELPMARDATLTQKINALLQGIPDLEQDQVNLLARMVNPDPKRRYQKAADILADLRRLGSDNSGISTTTLYELELSQPSENTIANIEKTTSKTLPYRFTGIAALALLVIAATSVAMRLPQRVIARQHLHAAAALSTENPEAAITEYDQALALSPQNPAALARRSLLHSEVGNLEAALSDITQAIEQTPTNPSYSYDRGNLRFALGDIQGAIQDYTQAIEQDPAFVRAYVNRGSARADWGDDKGAVEDYTQAIALAADTDTQAAAYLNRCLSYSNLDEQMLALDDCTQAINLRPSHGLAYQNRGLVRRRLGNFQGALQDYNIAIQIAPGSPDPYYNRGLTRQAMDDVTGAMQDFTKAIEIAPDYVFAIYDRGLLQADLGQYGAALTDLRKAAQICLDLGRTGCYEDAQYQISRLENLVPNQPPER